MRVRITQTHVHVPINLATVHSYSIMLCSAWNKCRLSRIAVPRGIPHESPNRSFEPKSGTTEIPNSFEIPKNNFDFKFCVSSYFQYLETRSQNFEVSIRRNRSFSKHEFSPRFHLIHATHSLIHVPQCIVCILP